MFMIRINQRTLRVLFLGFALLWLGIFIIIINMSIGLLHITGAGPQGAFVGVARDDLGVLEAGGKLDTHIQLFNSSVQPVEIVEVRTSCPCVVVRLPNKKIIPPHQTAELEVRIDLSDEREFTGKLAPKIEFLDSVGRKLFCRILDFDVIAEPIVALPAEGKPAPLAKQGFD